MAVPTASKDLVIRFIADTSKWEKQLKKFQSEMDKVMQAGKGFKPKVPTSGVPGSMPNIPGAPNLPNLPNNKGSFSFKEFFGQSGEATSFLRGDMVGALTSLAAKFAVVTAAVLFFTNSMGKIISVGAAARSSIVQFQTLLGGSEAAAVGLNNVLKKFNKETTLEMPQLREGAASLLGVKVAMDDLVPTLRMLGDISQGANKDFNELVQIFAKNKSSGIIQGEDLNQLVIANIPILDVLAEKYKVSTMEIKAMASKNLITFQDLNDAFEMMTKEGGLYFNAMKRQALEVPGIWSNIMDSWNDIFLAISGADLSSSTISFWHYLKTTLADFADRFAAFVEYIRPLLVDFGTAIGAAFRSIWDVLIAVWDVIKVQIYPIIIILYGALRAFLWVLTKSLQTISAVAKAISFVVNLVYKALDSLLGISHAINEVIKFLENFYIKITTIFVTVSLMVEAIFDKIMNMSLSDLSDRLYNALVQPFIDAWAWIRNSEIYRFIERSAAAGVQVGRDLVDRARANNPFSNSSNSTAQGSSTSVSTSSSSSVSTNSSSVTNNNYNIRLTDRERRNIQDTLGRSGRPLSLNPI